MKFTEYDDVDATSFLCAQPEPYDWEFEFPIDEMNYVTGDLWAGIKHQTPNSDCELYSQHASVAILQHEGSFLAVSKGNGSRIGLIGGCRNYIPHLLRFETMRETLLRECKEEAGVYELLNIKHWKTFTFTGRLNHKCSVYHATATFPNAITNLLRSNGNPVAGTSGVYSIEIPGELLNLDKEEEADGLKLLKFDSIESFLKVGCRYNQDIFLRQLYVFSQRSYTEVENFLLQTTN
jgi:8-oxo-dGTP pyrophosphatase MutT (NUDIX family)